MSKEDDTHSVSTTRLAGRWSQERRLEFIDFRLRWDGRLNRGDIVDYFGISIPQASLDIARYLEVAPGNLVYDRRSRVYLATETFKPVFPESGPQRFLNELLARASGIVGPETSFIGWQPSTAVAPSPARSLDADVLRAVLRAIREEHALQVLYQSMAKTEPTVRTLTPLAMAHDGFRWHVRAFCHSRLQCRDFVIARILKVNGVAPAGAKSADDLAWHNVLQLVLKPHPGLTEAKQRAIELDYGMTNGEVTLECREALLFYVLRRLGLEPRRPDTPEAQQIVLSNAPAIAPYLKSSDAGGG
jgi:hypothetical protein